MQCEACNTYLSGNLFWDDTNGFLGIGTSTPSTKLHVVGSEITFAVASGAMNFYNTPGANSHFNFTNLRQDSDYTFRQNRNGAVNTTSFQKQIQNTTHCIWVQDR